jgi:hypothetical protein
VLPVRLRPIHVLLIHAPRWSSLDRHRQGDCPHQSGARDGNVHDRRGTAEEHSRGVGRHARTSAQGSGCLGTTPEPDNDADVSQADDTGQRSQDERHGHQSVERQRVRQEHSRPPSARGATEGQPQHEAERHPGKRERTQLGQQHAHQAPWIRAQGAANGQFLLAIRGVLGE